MWLNRARLGRLLGGFALAAALVVVLTSVAAPSSARSASACTPSWHAVPAATVGTVGDSNSIAAVAAESSTDAWAVIRLSDLIEHWDGQHWTVSQPNSDKHYGYGRVLTGIAAASPSAAWAVGYHTEVTKPPKSPAPPASPLIESWDGTSWRVDRTPTLTGRAWLNGVVVVAANDVWAVGGRTVTPLKGNLLVATTLIEHWDGTSWQVIPSPNIGPATDKQTRFGWQQASDNELLSVAAVSADDIWTVGDAGLALRKYKNKTTYEDSPYRVTGLAEHWNGTTWSLGPRPPFTVHPGNDPISGNPAYYGFTAVAAAPSGDVLALAADPLGNSPHHTPGWRFTGSAWSPAYQVRGVQDIWNADAVTDTAHNDAWIIGNPADRSPTFGFFSVVGSHWDGQHWTQIKLPAWGIVNAATASATNDIWAGGDLERRGSRAALGYQEVMLHYAC